MLSLSLSRLVAGTPCLHGNSMKLYTLKLSPHPQLPFAFGFSNTNSEDTGVVWKSIVVPTTWNNAFGSTNTRTPAKKGTETFR